MFVVHEELELAHHQIGKTVACFNHQSELLE